MKLKNVLVALLWGIAVLGLASGPAAGQQKAPEEKRILVKIAIIDIKAIRQNALVVKNINAQIEKYGKAFEEEIKKEEEALRTAEQELARQRTILSPEAFDAERKKFEQRVVEVQRSVQQRKADLVKAHNDAMHKVEETLNELVAQFAGEQEITLILRKDMTILNARALEVTAAILDRLNKKLPTLKVAGVGK